MPEKKSSQNAQGIFDPVDVEDVPWEEFNHGKFGMRYKQLGEFGGASKLGLCFEELDPGKQANQAHYHFLEEEHIYILEGEMTLTLGETKHLLTPGKYVCFPAGQTQAHSIYNHSESVCRYLVMSDRNPNDVIIYPDSDKVSVRATGQIYRNSNTLNYWDGVED